MNRITFGILLIILILSFALAVPAAAGQPVPDHRAVPLVAQDNLPYPDHTGNMIVTYDAGNARYVLYDIVIGGSGGMSTMSSPPRPYYGDGDSD